jgi:hypothetical protein
MGLTAEIERVSAPRFAGDWIGAIHGAARDLEESLADPARLGQLADELTQVAASTGARMVTGASPLGNQLAGLVAGRPGSGLTLWAQNGAHGTLLVIEGVLASGAQLARTAARARAAGADRVVGAAVVAEPRGLAICREELGDDVRALRELDFVPDTLPGF